MMMTACRSNESMQEKAEAEEEKNMMKKRKGVTGTFLAMILSHHPSHVTENRPSREGSWAPRLINPIRACIWPQ